MTDFPMKPGRCTELQKASSKPIACTLCVCEGFLHEHGTDTQCFLLLIEDPRPGSPQVATIGLSVIARPARNERMRDDDAALELNQFETL